MTIQEHEQTRAAWDKIAAGYDDFVTSTHLGLGSEGLRRADLRPGMRFLAVAAGSGALCIPAARLGAQVLATDQSPAMLSRLTARARQEGLSIETRVMDGHALELDDDSFDMAGSQFGVMLFPDMPKGIREMARVVRPGGRVLVIAFGDSRRIEFFDFFVRAIRSVRPDFEGPPTDPPPLPFQLQDPERLRSELAAVGLKDVEVGATTEAMEFRTGKNLWDWLVRSNPIVETVLGGLDLTSDERRDPGGAGPEGPRARRRRRPGRSDQPHQHRDRDEMTSSPASPPQRFQGTAAMGAPAAIRQSSGAEAVRTPSIYKLT